VEDNAKGSKEQDVLKLTFDVVRRMLSRGFQAGYLADAGEFEAWPNQRPEAVVNRIQTEWNTEGRVNTEMGVWFDQPDAN
jgi:hypothetical protein